MNLDIDLNLEECNKDIVEHANDNWEDSDCEKSLEPYKGMEFDSQDDAYSFYLKYSKFIGFGISKKSSRRSKIFREFIDVKIVCTRYGLKKEKDVSGTRHSQKVDCKAILHVKKKIQMVNGMHTTLSKIIPISFFRLMHTIFHAIETLIILSKKTLILCMRLE